MSVEFPTPKADAPTFRIPYEEVATIEEAVAWIRHPPFPPEALKKLKKGVLLTARMQAEWVRENEQRGEEIAAMGLVLRAGTRNVPAKIALITRDGIAVDGERVGAKALGLGVTRTNQVAMWSENGPGAPTLLSACDGVPGQLLTMASCAIARTVLKFIPVGEERPRKAVGAGEAWTRGEVTLSQVETVRSAAWVYWSTAADTVHRSTVAAAKAAWAGSVGASLTANYAEEAVWSTSVAAWHVVREKYVRIVRKWIGLPEVAYAAITREK